MGGCNSFSGCAVSRMKKVIYLLKVDAGRDEEGALIFKAVRAFRDPNEADRIARRDYPKPSLYEIEEMKVE